MNDNNEELLKRISDLEREISELKNNYSGFDKTFKEHQHSKRDDSAKIREGSINLKNGGYFTTCGGNFGGGAVFLGVNYQTEGLLLNQANIVTGEGLYKYDSLFKTPTGETDQSPFASLVLLKQKYSGGGAYSDDAFLYAYNDSYMLAPENLTIKSGDTTISHYSFNFENKNLANYILTLRVNGVDYGFLISSNTKNSITFTPASTIDGTISYVFIYKPVYLGSTAGTFKRILLQEGVRFGLGTTGNGQNGLLYMNSSGNLIFRKPNNSEITIGGLNISYYIFSFYETETLKSTTVPSGTIPLGWYVPQNGLLNNPNLAWVSIYVSGTTLYCQLSQSPGASGSNKAIAILVRYYYP